METGNTRANPVSGEPSQAGSLHQQLVAKLQAEQGQPSQPPESGPPPTPGLSADQGDGQVDEEVIEDTVEDGQADITEPETAVDDSTDAAGAESDADSEEPTEWQARERELIEAAEAAEVARHSMEKDYRRKTHKLSEAMRAVEAQTVEVAQAAQYMLQLAQGDLSRFDGVNWAQLKTDPEQYQQAQQAYMQADQMVRQRQADLEQIKQHAQQAYQQNQARIAEHSRGILAHQLPGGWNDEVYNELRQFAADNYDYSDEEFAQVVDWRVMKMLHDAKRASDLKQQSAEVVKKVGKQGGQRSRKATRNVAQQQRNAKGQFVKAKQEAQARPGDRAAMREMFRAKLELERQGRR